MKQNILFFFFALILLGFVSCDKEELEATVPAYLVINDIKVETTEPIQGSSSDNIKDAWVFIDDQLIGTFEIPSIIPIIETGFVNLKVRGGIFNNGVSNDREIYPFYDFYEENILLEAGKEYSPDIVVKYKNSLSFDTDWDGEDFEQGISFTNNSESGVTLSRVSNSGNASEVFEGDASGKIVIPAGKSRLEIYSPLLINMRRSGSQAYIELNYRSTTSFNVNFYINNQSAKVGYLTLKESADWNKVYIDAGRIFSDLLSALNFNLVFDKVTSGDNTETIWLDNIKLIEYE